MIHIVIQSASIILQAAATVIAFSLIRVTGKRVAWILVGISFGIMVLRRIYSLESYFRGVRSPVLFDDIMALVISSLILVGILMIRPLFEAMSEAGDRIRMSERRMESQRDYFQAIVNQSLDALLMLDRDTNRVRFCNERTLQLFGASDESDIVGKTWADLLRSPFHSLNSRDIGEALDRDQYFNGSFPFSTFRGDEFWGDVSINRIDIDGELYLRVRITEVTERKEAEEALRLKTLELENLNNHLSERVREEIAKRRQQEEMLMIQSRQAAMGEMIGNIAHQWKTPLNALGLLIQNLGDTWRFSTVDETYILDFGSRGMGLVQHLSDTMDDFRDFFKPQREKKPFSLKECIEKTFMIVYSGLMNENITLQVDVEKDISINGFRNEFSQALLNLINNAREALREKKPHSPHIRVRLKQEGDFAVIIVEDNAGGIDPEHFDRLYQPYFTTKPQGTGLGLSMTRTIIEKNFGGTISVRNAENGAEFTIRIPVDKPAEKP